MKRGARLRSEPVKLHEFLSQEREELITICLEHLHRDIPARDDQEIGPHLREYIDEIIQIMRRADGLETNEPEAKSSAAEVARDRRRRGFRIEQLVPTYTAISVAVGELGGRKDRSFSAHEYGIFNQAIDRHVAEAIEEYAADARIEQEQVFGERLGFLAHELRNALSSAKMAFRMLERGYVAIAGRTADIVRRNHRRMETLIEQTLDAARARSGVKPVLHEVRVAPVLREVEVAAVLERGIHIALEADDSLVALSDEHLLSSVVSNLVQNAIKFSHQKATIRVRAQRDDGTVAIEVEDECGGLPEGTREDLFRPFVQRGTDRRGVGLGLAIAWDAMTALEGEIQVHDRPGRGCTFVVRLPGPSQESASHSETRLASPPLHS